MKDIKIEKSKNNIVSKANILIEKKDNLSGNSRKMLAMIISMIKHDDKEFMQYALNRKEYLSLINSKSNNDKFFKDTAKELMRNPFEIDGVLYNWCSKVDTVSSIGNIIFEIHEDLKPYLLNLKEEGNFTQYKIINILALKGEYNQKLYEYLIMRINKKKKYREGESVSISIEELRELLNVPKSYKYAIIKMRILDKAVREFADKTDIKISYTEVKQGRKVVSLDIVVQENSRGSSDFLSSERDFISYVRNSFINKTLLKYKDSAGKEIELAVCPEGKLYNKKEPSKAIDPKNSKMLWSTLYQYALKGKLEVFE